jgi:hypothetical protein
VNATGDESGGSGGQAPGGGPRSPLDRAGWGARLSFSWLNGLLAVGYRRQLTFADVPGLPARDTTTAWARRFQVKGAQWMRGFRGYVLNPELSGSCNRRAGGVGAGAGEGGAVPAARPPRHVREGVLPARSPAGNHWPSLRPPAACGKRADEPGVPVPVRGVQLASDLLGFSGPVLLKLIVSFVQDYGTGTATTQDGFILLGSLVGCYVLSAVISTQYGLRMGRVQLHVRTALVSAVYAQVKRAGGPGPRQDGRGSGCG